MDIDGLVKEIEEKRLKKALDGLTDKDLITVYLNVKEYQRAKLQRTTAAPYTHDDTEIKLVLVTAKDEIDLLNNGS